LPSSRNCLRVTREKHACRKKCKEEGEFLLQPPGNLEKTTGKESTRKEGNKNCGNLGGEKDYFSPKQWLVCASTRKNFQTNA